MVTYTEELAYKQAKEADDLLSQGTYLGMFSSLVDLFDGLLNI